jgi:hypothetical protein
MARLSEQFAMHPLSQDERVTCESMLAQVQKSQTVQAPPARQMNDFFSSRRSRRAGS